MIKMRKRIKSRLTFNPPNDELTPLDSRSRSRPTVEIIIDPKRSIGGSNSNQDDIVESISVSYHIKQSPTPDDQNKLDVPI